jgi:hypothetical protein
MRENETEVQVYSYWWIDDYEKATRYSRKEVTSVFRPDRVNVYDLLEQRIMSLLSWAPNSWTDTTAGYERDWSSTKRMIFLKSLMPTLYRKYNTRPSNHSLL